MAGDARQVKIADTFARGQLTPAAFDKAPRATPLTQARSYTSRSAWLYPPTW